MTSASGSSTTDEVPAPVRVHVIGAGPVGLLLTALLQPYERFSIHLYEKRQEYTRTRMVQLAPSLVARSVEGYCTDYIDEESVRAVFDPGEIADALAFRSSIPADLMSLLRVWTQGFCPLNEIELSLSRLIDQRTSRPVRRTLGMVKTEEALAFVQPGDVLIDCTGTRSVLRDVLVPDATDAAANTFTIRLEYALVITFLYGQAYECNEYCKYYKNIGNSQYKFIPAVNRTHYDGNVSHVTGIVNISEADYDAMPSHFDGSWLREHFPNAAASMDRFIDKIKAESNGEIIGDLDIIRIPLQLYHARNATNREWRRRGPNGQPLSNTLAFLVGDSAMGSPYFQSISLGFECAMYLASLLQQDRLATRDMLDRYELYAYKQWLRVYMRSKMIKHNKDVLECLGDDYAILEKLHIY